MKKTTIIFLAGAFTLASVWAALKYKHYFVAHPASSESDVETSKELLDKNNSDDFIVDNTIDNQRKVNVNDKIETEEQNKIIDELLDRPIKVTVINGDTFLQRNLTDYLNFTLGHSHIHSDIIESDINPSISTVKDYFMRPHPNVSTLKKYFKQASKEFGVPLSLLMVIGQIESNWTQIGPTIDQGWGIMHLVQNHYCNTLGEAARILEVSEQTLKDSAFHNIRGAAALISHYAGKEKVNFKTIEDWFPAISLFSGLVSKELRDLQAKNYYETLNNGVRSITVWSEKIEIEPVKNNIK